MFSCNLKKKNLVPHITTTLLSKSFETLRPYLALNKTKLQKVQRQSFSKINLFVEGIL